MRHYVLQIIFIISSFSSTAQSYQPLLVPDRTWVVATSYSYEQCLGYLPPWSDCTIRQQYFLSGDTIIQGLQYQQCMRQSFSLSSSATGPFTLGLPEYSGAVREDIDNRKVYAYDTSIQSEVLLYDFNLLPGEEVIVRLNPFWAQSSNYAMIVDTVFWLPDGRKKWILNGTQEMVEGVGMSSGLFPSEICFEACTFLACLSENGVPVFEEIIGRSSFSLPLQPAIFKLYRKKSRFLLPYHK